jgi:hypothetical protein
MAQNMIELRSDCEISKLNELMTYNINQTINANKLLRIIATFSLPFISDRFDQKEDKIVCGPLIKLIKELSMRYGYRYSMFLFLDKISKSSFGIFFSISLLRISASNLDELKEMLSNGTKINIVLFPTTESIADIMASFIGEDIFKYSKPLGIISEGHILSAVKPGIWPKLKFFLSFETNVCISLIASLILILLFKALVVKSLTEFFPNLWELIASMLGRENLKLRKTFKEYTVYSIWLISWTILLSAFSGVMYRSFIEPLPKITIDSWEDLYERNDVRIITPTLSFLANYAKSFREIDPMARDFESRLEEEVLFNASEELLEELVAKTCSGSYAFSAQQFHLESYLIFLEKKFINSVHISKYGGGVSPYFLPIHELSNNLLETDINKL